MNDFAKLTVDIAKANVDNGGRPFACVITRDDSVIAASPNLVVQTGDPTAHAEVVAIRDACTKLATEQLTGCTIWVLAHPCPMCLGALYYCSPDRVVFLTTRESYAVYYRDDRRWFELESFYAEFAKPWDQRRLPMDHQPDPRALEVYAHWSAVNAT